MPCPICSQECHPQGLGSSPRPSHLAPGGSATPRLCPQPGRLVGWGALTFLAPAVPTLPCNPILLLWVAPHQLSRGFGKGPLHRCWHTCSPFHSLTSDFCPHPITTEHFTFSQEHGPFIYEPPCEGHSGHLGVGSGTRESCWPAWAPP